MADEGDSEKSSESAPTYGRGQHPNTQAVLKANAYKPGQSGNPTGRPTASLMKQFRELAQDQNVNIPQLVLDIATGAKRADRQQLDAIKIVFDRGWGKALETVLTGDLDSGAKEAVAELSRVELAEIVAGLKPAPETVAVTDVPPSGTSNPPN